MSSQPIRIQSETLRALRKRSEQSGEPIVRLAQRYIDEGMRLDRHPGIVFRDGPAGRRAVVVGGPDVWEVIAAARSAPERGEGLIEALPLAIDVTPRAGPALGHPLSVDVSEVKMKATEPTIVQEEILAALSQIKDPDLRSRLRKPASRSRARCPRGPRME